MVWEDDQNNDGNFTIRGSGFYANGSQRFGDIDINSDTSGHQEWPAIAMDSFGRFVVAWQDDMDSDDEFGILMRNFGF